MSGDVERLPDGRVTGPPLRVPRPDRTAVVARVGSGYLLALSEMTADEAHRIADFWRITFPDAPALVIRGSLVDLTGDPVPAPVRAWLDEAMAKVP